MLSMTKWVYVIKILLKSSLTKKEIRSQILTYCLYSQRKFLGAYQVNQDKVWNNIIMQDRNCVTSLKKLKIDDVYSLMGYYEEIEYRNMRYTYPRKHCKKG